MHRLEPRVDALRAVIEVKSPALRPRRRQRQLRPAGHHRQSQHPPKHLGKLGRDVKGIECSEGRAADQPRLPLGARAVMGVHRRHEFGRDEIRIRDAAQIQREIDVALAPQAFAKSLGMAYAHDDRLRHRPLLRQPAHPFIDREIDAGDRARPGIEHVRAIVEIQHRIAPLRLRRVTRRQPDQQLAPRRQSARIHPIPRQPPRIAILPIRHRAMHRRVQPHVVAGVRRHAAPGIHGLRLPAPAQQLELQRRPGVRLDHANVPLAFPAQRQCPRRAPFAQRADIPADEHRFLRMPDGRNDLEANATHGGDET